ncbi:F-box protein At5g07610 isoform X1 [Spinacia oleracea]|uniref:F-box protein At5g07610 isoform X1 n=1 Tax=Spinacia oleracea TaxID=3562 RepID=A0A9R0K2Y8_SPIOL|nr:F-box protein At5g07610-like isoform X1 [Spinacia oleracea]XP_056687747.1 F-box protein At5g07610-like isoform X1 [Spinacia oleracea]XP_056687748.1 F-box protein At5g07610-like isoform X1 [Spinacia oleracea]XP_056687749.1 F-box protein At5g07610-like isoform X1 [Spinacia oleracea]XP_056687750.1 F-box protein At5g07610-like isoform X1 [Spinacia oleracea]XP_056687751.1 F-box protein At5g07610-like isoform X1 [Spinacia oleracea]XP_056687752.1 F-box protein At5g07610-like isoform X1 [Spinacia 
MSQTTNTNSKLPNSIKSAETIGNNEDVASEVLVYVPVKSLINFRKVSPLWRSLIFSFHFVKRYNLLHPPSLSGLFLIPKHRFGKENNQIECISLGENESNSPVSPILNMISIKVLQSCNGLLLICKEGKLYIFNPTTQQKKLIPNLFGNFPPAFPLYYSLVFDPSISPHYKIICLINTRHNKYKISIYSSNSNQWKPSKAPDFFAPHDIDFTTGIYCNGSVHWTKRTMRGLYFDVENETLNHMPESPRQEQYSCEYFGHSKGYLYCMFTMEGLHYYELFEMEKDYSSWVFKSKVELNVMASQFPNMDMGIDYHHPQFMYQCQVLSVFRGHNGEVIEVIMSIPGEVIAYDCKSKKSRQICKSKESGKEREIWYGVYQVFEYYESISPVSFQHLTN